jgi:hypothetical protein
VQPQRRHRLTASSAAHPPGEVPPAEAAGRPARAGHDVRMVSRWEPPDREMIEIEVEARPRAGREPTAAARPGAATASSVDAARRAARALQVVAWLIPVGSVVGFVLTTFWVEEDGPSGVSVRRRIGDLLSFVWVPVALAALVYAASFLLSLYAARVELDADRAEGPRRG